MNTVIFIPGNFPSFKNSKQFVGKGRLIMSKTVLKYLKEYENYWKEIPQEFKDIKETDYPILVGIHLVRNSRHRFDFHNMVQGIADLMVKHLWIPDDNMDYFIPLPMKINDKYYSFNKDNPGVLITIL